MIYEIRHYRQELDLLLFLTRYPQRHLSPSFIAKDINWPQVLSLAKTNKVVPFLAHLLTCPKCNRELSKPVRQALKQEYLSAFLTYEEQEKEKKLLNRLIKNNRLAISPLKDYAFYGLKYPDSLFPQKADLDYFVWPGKNLILIDRALRSRGYRSFEFAYPKDKYALLEKDYRKKIHQVTVFVNLHQNFLLPETADKVNPLAAKTIKEFQWLLSKDDLTLEMHFIYHCLHYFFRDHFAGLKSLFEIAQVLTLDEKKVNWTKVLAVTQKLGLESYFLFVVSMAGLVYEIKLNDKLARRVQQMKNVQIALKLYSPYLSLLPESPAEWFNHRLNRRVRDYRFLIKLILWSEPFYRKIGPRVLWLLGSSLIPVFFSLPKK